MNSTSSSSQSAEPTSSSEHTTHLENPPRPVGSRFQRGCIKIFFGAFVVALTVDTFPNLGPAISSTKWYFSSVLNRVGLWQGQWTLFAPNPKINNAWLAAEVYRPDRTQHEFWNSTYWAETSGWERFSGFRHINYNNRIQTQGQRAANDLADYLARRLIGPAALPVEENSLENDARESWRLVLSRSELNLSLPDDGHLPSRDETLWISTSQNLTVREYLP